MIDSKRKCEFLRHQAKQRFDKVRGTWIDCGLWALPHRVKWLLSQTEGERNNRHIVDPTHILALRSYVAGFLEGNTSASRPWFRNGTKDPELMESPNVKEYLWKLNRRAMSVLSTSNFYNAAGQFYYDLGVFNTGAYWIDELPGLRLHFHPLTPGGYYVLNNGYGEAVVLIREFTLTVKALVDTYGRKVNGGWNWSNISSRVRKMYEEGNYQETIEIVQVAYENDQFNPEEPIGGRNQRWVSRTYELGSQRGQYMDASPEFMSGSPDPRDEDKYLRVSYRTRKPFIVGRSESSNNFEYGEKGPTLDALGLIKSLNKKAIAKDQALELMLQPPMQGPASLKKSYISSQPKAFVPLDAQSLAQQGLRPIFEVNPAIGALTADVIDMRQQVDRLYYADFLLYLSRNPRTRTATETNAILQEQQLIIGPILQSLNFTHNEPTVDYVTEYVLDEDGTLEPPPEELAGQFLRTEFISVFAQAQRAADLPSIDRYVQNMMNVAQLNPKSLDKVNLDKLADLYEDRLYLPPGLNRPQGEVDAMRERAMMQQQRQQMLQETLPAVAGAARDMGIQMNTGGEE